MERLWKTIILICVIYLASVMIIAPVECVTAAQSAVKLCLEVVIPSLFPFFICSNLFISLGAAKLLGKYLSGIMRPLFGVSGSGALAMVLGVISGYPIGASCAVNLYSSGHCTKSESERLLTFCNNSGPLFVMGAVGIGMLCNQKLGILLYTAHVLSALATGLIFRSFGKEPQGAARSLPPAGTLKIKNAAAAVGTAVADSVDSILKVCGFVILFAVFAAALPSYNGSQFIYALLEITGGVKALLGFEYLGSFLLPMVSMFIAFSGVSVLLQVAAIVIPGGLSVRPYILGKLTQGIISFFLTMLLLLIFPIEQQTFLTDALLYVNPTPRELLVTAILSIIWCAISIAVLVFAAWLYDKFEKSNEDIKPSKMKK